MNAQRAAGRRRHVLAAILLALHALAYLPWTEDDAGVTFRYTSNLVDGHGLVYNPGEHVEALTNLGYAVLLAPVYALLPGPDPRPGLVLAAKLLGLVAALLTLGEVRALARAVGLGESWSGTAALLVAGSGPVAAWAVGGLETPFVLWASTAWMRAAAEMVGPSEAASSTRRRAAVAGASLVLLRADGFVLPVAASALALLIRVSRRSLGWLLAPAVLTWIAVTGFRLLYYGAPVPNPVHAKVDLLASLLRSGETSRQYLWPFLNLHGTLLPLAGGLLVAMRRRGTSGRPLRLLALASLAWMAYVVAVGGDWMPLFRFLVPAVPFLVVLGLTLGASLAARIPRATPLVGLALALGLVGGAALAGRQSFKTRRAAPFWYFSPSLSPGGLVSFWQPAVDWIEANTASDSLLLTSEAGFIPWLSGRPTADSYGLAEPRVAHLPRGSVTRSSLGVETRFTEAAPVDPAQAYLASLPAAALVLQDRMVKGWNDGRTPAELFAGTFRLDPGSPVGGRWAVYRRRAP